MSHVTYDELTTGKVQTDTLAIHTKTITGISDDDTDRSMDKIPTSLALFTGLNKLQSQISVLNELGYGVENVVISSPLVSPIFADGAYPLLGWEIINQTAVYRGDVTPNYLQFPHTLFTANNYYLINIKVHYLQSGHLELRNKDGDTIAVITTIGDYYYDITAESDTTFKLVAVGVEYGKAINISYIAVHKIANQFYNYLYNKIQELSSVDGRGYVDKVLFETRMSAIEADFITAITNMDGIVDAHIHDTNNPHGVTPELIQAAAKNHDHDERYNTKGEVVELLLQAINTCAPKIHIHTQYTTLDAVDSRISSKLSDALKKVYTVQPLCLLEGPAGMIPELYAHAGITSPTQVLIVNTFKHNPIGEYDINSGFASCNVNPIDDTTIIDAFSPFKDMGKYAKFNYPHVIPDTNRVVLHYQFHRNRKLLGYKIRGMDNAYAKKWATSINFNTFVHTVSSNGFVADGYEVILAESTECNSISIEILESAGVSWFINIEFIFDDIATGHIGVTQEPLLFSMPRGGNNLIFTLDMENIEDLYPVHKIEGLPVYVFVDVDHTGIETIDYTYIPPEFGTQRMGIDVFSDRYIVGINISHPEHNPFTKVIHPIFGTLELLDCGLCEKILTSIYTTGSTWIAPANQKSAIISHTFLDSEYLVGYDLEWDKEFADILPTDWTLYLTTVKDDGTTELVVVDSVTQYGSKLNYNNSSILYCKKFNQAYRISKMELHLNNVNETGLYLTSFKPMLTHDFYSAPKNTMYHGEEVVSRIYLGEVEFHDGDYKINSQLTIGKTCQVPINNLETTQVGYEYKITNPFHTTDVSCSVRVVDGDYTVPPICTVTDIKEDVISVIAFSKHKFSLTIVRNW